jgi:electron transfer flavoprotein alpha subunit
MSEDGELSQIRPAFGGNIMAHILTPNHRPQFATVRHKIFPVPEAGEPNALGGQVADGVDTDELEPLPGAAGMYVRDCSRLDLASGITVLGVAERPKVKGIEEADVLVVAGRGIRKQEDLATIERLCELLGAEIAGTRSLIEAGWVDPRRQIGLSGRTVAPKLLITVGVSGAIQFTAGMEGAEHVIAINSDPEARIFEFADTCVHGDLYEIVPRLIAKLESRVGEEGVAV